MRTTSSSADSARPGALRRQQVYAVSEYVLGLKKHLLNSTSSNIRLVLTGLVMWGAAVDVGLSLIQQAFNIVNIYTEHGERVGNI